MNKKTVFRGEFILIFLLLTIILDCKKPPIEIIQPKDIAGHWKWFYTFFLEPLSDSNPLTPNKTGIEEILVFNYDHSWYKTINNIVMDSGTYFLGHGKYLPYPGAHTFIYDSILYFRNGKTFEDGFDYYEIYNDTLHFTPYLGGRFSSYTLPYNGAKYWVKQ